MVKKAIEKESYLAPQWGLRTVRVERHFLTNLSDDSSDNGYDDGNDLGEI